jgi:HlyD family secretion protein
MHHSANDRPLIGQSEYFPAAAGFEVFLTRNPQLREAPDGELPMSRKWILISIAVVAVVGGIAAWLIFSKPGLPPGIAGGNGRLEAQQVDVVAKYAGRLKTVTADEGDTVDAGQVVATIDTEPLEAELRNAEAQIRGAQDNLRTALAQVKVKAAESDYAGKQYKRAQPLVKTGAISQQELDVDQAKVDAAQAALVGARAQSVGAQSAIDAATATAERLKAQIADNTLRAPIRARVESRIAQPGEVVAAGGKVLTTYDLSDVYMYVFLPTDTAGKVALGSEARIVLDSMPQNPIRATVSYVSPTAQFTPKTVETAEERHNLSFRVKLQIDKERLRAYEKLVKAGIPGMGYVRTDPKTEWPEKLQWKGGELPWNPTGAAKPEPAGAAKPEPADSK